MMKCSHGLPYEVKCSGCFNDAMKRVSASEPGPEMVRQLCEAGQKLFRLGGVSEGSRLNPETLVK
jgi:hypothetical protein